jgi:hypothetical protein
VRGLHSFLSSKETQEIRGLQINKINNDRSYKRFS